MEKWYSIRTQKDIEQLMSTYGDFHDACIISLNFQSGAFVDDENAMHFGSPEERVLAVVFQCQWEPKTIELQFIGLRQMHLVGWQDNYLCDIFEFPVLVDFLRINVTVIIQNRRFGRVIKVQFLCGLVGE